MAWRVPDFGNTICQKSTLGLANAMPTKRLSRFSRNEVTTQFAMGGAEGYIDYPALA